MVQVDSCCGCYNTKTGTIIIGSINMVLSVMNVIVFSLYLILLVIVGTEVGVSGHAVFIAAYIFIGIGMLSALLQFIFCIMLIKGVQKREPKWVRFYIYIGTVSLFFGLLSLVVGSYNIGILLWSVIVAAVQIYFLMVIYSEYKNILAEKESQNVGEFPMPSVAQKPVGFR